MRLTSELAWTAICPLSAASGRSVDVGSVRAWRRAVGAPAGCRRHLPGRVIRPLPAPGGAARMEDPIATPRSCRFERERTKLAGLRPPTASVRSRRSLVSNQVLLQHFYSNRRPYSVTSCRWITRGFAAIWSQVRRPVTRPRPAVNGRATAGRPPVGRPAGSVCGLGRVRWPGRRTATRTATAGFTTAASGRAVTLGESLPWG